MKNTKLIILSFLFISTLLSGCTSSSKYTNSQSGALLQENSQLTLLTTSNNDNSQENFSKNAAAELDDQNLAVVNPVRRRTHKETAEIKNEYASTLVQNMDKSKLSNTHGVPVLMYHSIFYEKGNDLRVPKENFQAQMGYLKENGYTTLSIRELEGFFINNTPLPEKSILITFDDGYEDNYTNAFPILKQYGLKGTIFIITNLTDKNSYYINSEQIKEMSEYGMDMQSHTVNHEDLSILPYTKQLETMKQSREALKKLLNKDVDSIAYPFGKFNNDTLRAAKEAGYKLAFTTRPGFSEARDGMLKLDRVRINGSDTLEQFKMKIKH